jgi:hypothetical protein
MLTRMTVMTAERALGLLDLLTDHDVWVDGGWGVDPRTTMTSNCCGV